MKDEGRAKAAQSQVHARYKPGASQGKAGVMRERWFVTGPQSQGDGRELEGSQAGLRDRDRRYG